MVIGESCPVPSPPLKPIVVKDFLFWLQQHRRLDVFLVLCEHGELSWGQAAAELRRRRTPVSDGTYRSACKGLVRLGLAEQVPLGSDTSMKFHYKVTESGMIVGCIVRRMIEDLETLSSPDRAALITKLMYDERVLKLSPDLRAVLFEDLATALENRLPILQNAE